MLTTVMIMSWAGAFLLLSLLMFSTQATEEKMIPVMKKVLRDFYGEKPEESKDYCRIGEKGNLSGKIYFDLNTA